MTETGTSVLSPVLVKVTNAGTRVQLSTTPLEFAAKSVLVQALGTNTESVVIGDKNVVAKAGSQATPEVRGIALEKNQVIAIDVIDPSMLWVDARTSKDGVCYWVLLS